MEQLKNNAATALDGSINNSVTSITVDDGSVFPSTGNFRLLCGSEIMLCTARSSNTLTVTRGHESSTAASHNDNDQIELVYTSGSFDQLIAEYYQSGGYSSRPSSPRKGTMYRATDLLNADWFYDGSAWSLIKPTPVPPAKIVDLTSWTALNHSTCIFTNKNGLLEGEFNVFSNNNLRGYTKSIPSAPYKINIGLNHLLDGSQPIASYIGVRENGTGKMKAMFYNAGNIGTIGLEFWNSATSFNSTIVSARSTVASARTWLRLEDDNTNWKWQFSRDGLNWTLLYSETRNTNMTSAADQWFMGFLHNATYSGSPNTKSWILSAWEGA